jgi:hypothetical protein
MHNNPNEPQLEGVVFTDGTVAVRWLTIPSTSIWRTLDEFLRIHGHLGNEDYRTEIAWHDPAQLYEIALHDVEVKE